MDAVDLLRLELDCRFPEVELMNALGIVFPQYWLQPNCDELFPLHMKTLKFQYCVCRTMNFGTKEEPVMKHIDPIIDEHSLSLQSSLFKLTMKSHAKVAMEEPHDQNLVTKLWTWVGQNAPMLNWLSEFIKVAEVAITAFFGSVEDERTFSTLSLKLQNRLGVHLDPCVKLYA